jgi:hypothetical protein
MNILNSTVIFVPLDPACQISTTVAQFNASADASCDYDFSLRARLRGPYTTYKVVLTHKP